MMPANIDGPADWREAEYQLLTQTARRALIAKTWPAWLNATGDWYAVQLTAHGTPVGPPLCWPNALLVAAWLMLGRPVDPDA